MTIDARDAEFAGLSRPAIVAELLRRELAARGVDLAEFATGLPRPIADYGPGGQAQHSTARLSATATNFVRERGFHERHSSEGKQSFVGPDQSILQAMPAGRWMHSGPDGRLLGNGRSHESLADHLHALYGPGGKPALGGVHGPGVRPHVVANVVGAALRGHDEAAVKAARRRAGRYIEGGTKSDLASQLNRRLRYLAQQ